MTTSVGRRLVDAVGQRDADALASCFAPDAELRALIPRGLRERTGAAESAAMIAGWFADATELELLESEVGDVGDRLHVSYRFRGVEDGEPFIVEQQLYCTIESGAISRAHVLCSGFRPRA